MPAKIRPDITAKKVWANVEKLRYEKGVTYERLGVAMRLNTRSVTNRKAKPIKITLEEMIRLADFFGIEVKELFK